MKSRRLLEMADERELWHSTQNADAAQWRMAPAAVKRIMQRLEHKA
jgi:hypothetical protein